MIVLSVLAAFNHAAMCSDEGRTLVHEAIIDASLDELWQLSTTSEGARLWMAPKVKADFRVGGSYRASYHPESNLDDEHTIINRILTYAPKRMLAIQNVKAPASFGNMERFQQTWSVMYFDEVDAERTRLRMVGLGYGEGPEWDQLYRFFEQGNSQVIASLNQAAKKLREQEATKRGADDVSEDDETKDAADEDDAQPLKPIVAETVVNASLEDAWRLWTTSEGVQEFLAIDSNIELKIGGKYEFYFGPNLPEGERGSENCKILAYEPHRMLSFSWNAPPHLAFAREHHSWIVIDFEQVAEEQVRVRLAQYGLEELRQKHPEHAEEFEATNRYFERAWPYVLEAMKTNFE